MAATLVISMIALSTAGIVIGACATIVLAHNSECARAALESAANKRAQIALEEWRAEGRRHAAGQAIATLCNVQRLTSERRPATYRLSK